MYDAQLVIGSADLKSPAMWTGVRSNLVAVHSPTFAAMSMQPKNERSIALLPTPSGCPLPKHALAFRSGSMSPHG